MLSFEPVRKFVGKHELIHLCDWYKNYAEWNEDPT